MSGEPLLQVKGSSLFGSGQKALRVFGDRIEATQSRWPASPIVETMRRDQIASVGTNAAPMLHADLVVESRGGARIVVKNLSRGNARAAKEAVEAIQAGAPGQAGAGRPTPDVPDQIRRLAELRDDGVLSAEEFEAKKAELLDRI